jgi:hypothetical protein
MARTRDKMYARYSYTASTCEQVRTRHPANPLFLSQVANTTGREKYEKTLSFQDTLDWAMPGVYHIIPGYVRQISVLNYSRRGLFLVFISVVHVITIRKICVAFCLGRTIRTVARANFMFALRKWSYQDCEVREGTMRLDRSTK